MAKKKQKRPLQDPNPASFGSSLGVLLQQQGIVKDSSQTSINSNESQPQPEASQETDPANSMASQGKLVLQREKKGRGGKTVTVLRGLSMDEASRKRLMKQMRKQLGCGARLEEETIVLQGDLMERAEAWLQKQGAKRVIRGN